MLDVLLPNSPIPVILAGGSGTRLWPVSRSDKPKQFQPLLDQQSLFQKTVLRALRIGNDMPPIVVTGEAHLHLVKEQLAEVGAENGIIIVEPMAKNTAPAIALAAHVAESLKSQARLLVLPSDHLIQDTEALLVAVERADSVAKYWNFLATFGVKPDRPETGYGYIRSGASLSVAAASTIAEFVEKPDLETATDMVESGSFLWNSGMFLLPATAYLSELDRFSRSIATDCRSAFALGRWDANIFHPNGAAFERCESISIDHAVMEKTDRAAVVATDPCWSDVGNWAALLDASDADQEGNAASGDVSVLDSNNCLVRSDGPLTCVVGVEDLIVVSTKDAVLVTSKSAAQSVKNVVEDLQSQNRSEADTHAVVQRPWGTYQSIDTGSGFQVKHITVAPGGQLSLQYHLHRSEHWTVVGGEALITVGTSQKRLQANESVYIPAREVHRLENPGTEPVHLIEVQCGDYLGEDDIVRLEDTYGRIDPAEAA